MTALAFFVLVAFQADDPIARAIRDLSHDDVAVRDRAAGELAGAGPVAYKPLRAARAVAKDAELQARIDDLVERLKTRLPLTVDTLKAAIVDIDLEKPWLQDVTAEIERQSGIAVRVATTIRLYLELQELRIRGISAATLLDVLCGQRGLLWGIDDREAVLIIHPERALDHFGDTRLYDIRTFVRPPVSSRPLKGVGLFATGPSADAADDRPDMLIEADHLASLIKSSVASGTWDVENAWINRFQSHLVIRHRPIVLDEVERYLQGLRRRFHPQVRVSVRLLAVKEGAAGLEEAGADVIRLGEAVLTGLAGIRVQSFAGREQALVAGYGPEGEVLREAIRDGLLVGVRSVPNADGTLSIDLSVDLARLQKVERVATKQGEVQMPTFETAEVRVLEEVAPGLSTVVARQSNPLGNGAEYPVLVTVVQATLLK